jgi:hypothetical protein
MLTHADVCRYPDLEILNRTLMERYGDNLNNPDFDPPVSGSKASKASTRLQRQPLTIDGGLKRVKRVDVSSNSLFKSMLNFYATN